ncbi:MAG: helix-turn-helix domain-containing protein [Bdellovibrionales bacterium]
MISIEQCRGARGILGWTQQDLADASGLSKTAINNFEKNHSDIKADSLRAIRVAFESADIEFIDQKGISKKTESFKIIHGESNIYELLEDIHLTLGHQKNGEIMMSFVDQSLTSQIPAQKMFKHIEFLKQTNTKQRVISYVGTQNVLSPSEECRWINNSLKPTATTTFIYGDKIAQQLYDKSVTIITRSVDAVNAERARFEQLWQSAIIPDSMGSNDSNKIIQNQ